MVIDKSKLIPHWLSVEPLLTFKKLGYHEYNPSFDEIQVRSKAQSDDYAAAKTDYSNYLSPLS
ncbi:MAG TPA: hypothetical protein VIJ27_11210 [Mucilaginibacter sp.]